ELHDAINWVRKAAEAASEADADMRVIELAKAASELSVWLEGHLAAQAAAQAAAQQVAAPSPLPSSEVAIDLEMSLDNAPRVELPKAPPPKPPPRKPPPPAQRPSPNKTPAQLVALPVDEVSSAEPEDPFAIPPALEPPPPSDNESLHRIPSVPPAPPDFAPTPMAMPVAKSIPPDKEPPPPSPKIAPPATERSSRTSTAPFGFPTTSTNETPSLANAALGLRPAPVPNLELEPEQLVPAIEVPQRPGILSPIPPKNPALQKTSTSRVTPQSRGVAIPAAPPRPRLPTPPMGSVPPPAPAAPLPVAPLPEPRVSLSPSALPSATGDDGVQSHASDAPPRMAQAPRTEIPAPPKPPSILPPRLSTLSGFPSQPPEATPSPASARTILLDPERFEVLADVPDDAREALANASEKVVLLPDEAARAPSMVIVLQGELEVRAKGFLTRLDVIGAGQVRLLAAFAPAEGELQVVAGAKGARFLGLDARQIETLRAAAPWVVQELEPASDDVHVVAGVLRGRHGRRLDGGILDAVLSRAKTMRLGPDVKVVKQGEAVRALIVLGAGDLSLRAGEGPDAPEIGTVELGEIVFAPELLQRQPAPSTVRAGPKGALVIVVTRGATEELLVTVPPLLELLGEG
ncbi:MAG: hypothetical protein ACXVEF_36820, partial [Polyangiales bacterium]